MLWHLNLSTKQKKVETTWVYQSNAWVCFTSGNVSRLNLIPSWSWWPHWLISGSEKDKAHIFYIYSRDCSNYYLSICQEIIKKDSHWNVEEIKKLYLEKKWWLRWICKCFHITFWVESSLLFASADILTSSSSLWNLQQERLYLQQPAHWMEKHGKVDLQQF